jgi:hypothetical protein
MQRRTKKQCKTGAFFLQVDSLMQKSLWSWKPESLCHSFFSVGLSVLQKGKENRVGKENTSYLSAVLSEQGESKFYRQKEGVFV